MTYMGKTTEPYRMGLAGSYHETNPDDFPVVSRARTIEIVDEAIRAGQESCIKHDYDESVLQKDKLLRVAREAKFLANGAYVTSGPTNGADLPPNGCGCLLVAAGIIRDNGRYAGDDDFAGPDPLNCVIGRYDALMSDAADGRSVVRIED